MSLAIEIQEFLTNNGTLVVAAIGCIVAISVIMKFLFSSNSGSDEENENEKETVEEESNKKEHSKANGHQQNGKAAHPKHFRSRAHNSSSSATSPCVVTSFRGHGDTVTDFDLSPNGCHLASVSPDRALFLWTFDDIEQREKNFSRVNVELDEAVYVSFSPDSKAFVTSLKLDNELQVWKVQKKQPESHPAKMTAVPFIKYETNTPNTAVVGCCVSPSGKFIATFTDNSTLRIWSLKGQLLSHLDTLQGDGRNGGLEVSPSGFLVATFGFTSEVRVFEVVFDNKGNFVELKRAFQIGGHKTSIVATAFDRESKRLVSVSKDGVWRLFNINVEYRLNQDPKILCHGTLPTEAISDRHFPVKAAVSVNSVILGTERSLYTFDGSPDVNDQLIQVDDLSGAVQTGVINRIRLDVTGEYALVAVGRAVLICSLFGELKLRIKVAKAALRGAKGAHAERLNQQITTLK